MCLLSHVTYEPDTAICFIITAGICICKQIKIVPVVMAVTNEQYKYHFTIKLCNV